MEYMDFFTGYNDTEDFRILIKARTKEQAQRLAEEYAQDAKLTGSWEITDGMSGRYDCDYIIAPYDDGEELEYVDDVAQA